MILIYFAGNKGGSGKSSSSHSVAHGLAMHAINVALGSTDDRRVLDDVNRRYAIFDARTQESLTALLDRLEAFEGVVIIDGAARRPLIDQAISEMATMTIVPFMASEEDFAVARQDLERMPRAVGLPNNWPHNAMARQAADRELEQMMGDLLPRMMSPQVSISAYKTLLSERGPAQPLNGPCKQLALRVLDRAGLSLFDLRKSQNAAAS